jgi:hypothetical protein
VHEELKRERGHYKALCAELRASLKHSDARWEALPSPKHPYTIASRPTHPRRNLGSGSQCRTGSSDACQKQANRSIVQDAQDRLFRLQEQVGCSPEPFPRVPPSPPFLSLSSPTPPLPHFRTAPPRRRRTLTSPYDLLLIRFDSALTSLVSHSYAV